MGCGFSQLFNENEGGYGVEPSDAPQPVHQQQDEQYPDPSYEQQNTQYPNNGYVQEDAQYQGGDYGYQNAQYSQNNYQADPQAEATAISNAAMTQAHINAASYL